MASPAVTTTSQLPFDVIVFDLDDTLLDTSRYLIPQASLESCEAMVRAGLQTTVETCLAERESFMRTNPRGSVYEHLATHFPSPDKYAVLKAGYDSFYSREVQTSGLHLVPGALELLRSLKGRYRLYLLTAGTIATQKKKVELLGIKDFFDDVFYVDPSRGESKETYFKKLVGHLTPARLLSVGNRLDTDLAPAKKWNWKTCWVRHGEYKHMTPISADENADAIIENLGDLSAKCQL